MRWRTANNRCKPHYRIHPLTGDYALYARRMGFISWSYNIYRHEDITG